MKKYIRKFLDWMLEDSEGVEETVFRIFLCVGVGIFLLIFLFCLVAVPLLLLHMIF